MVQIYGKSMGNLLEIYGKPMGNVGLSKMLFISLGGAKVDMVTRPLLNARRCRLAIHRFVSITFFKQIQQIHNSQGSVQMNLIFETQIKHLLLEVFSRPWGHVLHLRS